MPVEHPGAGDARTPRGLRRAPTARPAAGVDHDQVVRSLVGQRLDPAEDQEILDPRCRGGDDLENPGGGKASDQSVEPVGGEPLNECLIGVIDLSVTERLRHPRLVGTVASSYPWGSAPNIGADADRRHLDEENRQAGPRCRCRHRRGGNCLPDPTLPATISGRPLMRRTEQAATPSAPRSTVRRRHQRSPSLLSCSPSCRRWLPAEPVLQN